MCRHATFALPPAPGSASAAREIMRRCFVDWELAEVVDDMEVALTELVTNALLHARTPLEVSLSSESGMIEVAVFDGSPRLPTPRPHRLDLLDPDPVTSGRGLLLVDALAAEWGVSPLSDGKAVWIRTPVPAGWPHAAACPCPTSADAIALASGSRALHNG